MSINVIASIRKQASVDPETGNCFFYPSLALFAEDGTEYGAPIYFSGFDELAHVLETQAGVTRDVLEDGFDRYDRGEDARIRLILENEDAISDLRFPHEEAA